MDDKQDRNIWLVPNNKTTSSSPRPEPNKNVASTTLGETQLHSEHDEFDLASYFAAKACLGLKMHFSHHEMGLFSFYWGQLWNLQQDEEKKAKKKGHGWSKREIQLCSC